MADPVAELLQLISARPTVRAELSRADLGRLLQKFPETCLALTAGELPEGGRDSDAAADQPHHTFVEEPDDLRCGAGQVIVISDETLMAVMADLGSGPAAGGETRVVGATEGTVPGVAAHIRSIRDETAALAASALGVTWEQIAVGLGWEEMTNPGSDAETQTYVDTRNELTRAERVEVYGVVDAAATPTALLAFVDFSTDGEAYLLTRPALEDSVPRSLATRVRAAVAYAVVDTDLLDIAVVSAAVVVDSEGGRQVARGGDVDEILSQLEE